MIGRWLGRGFRILCYAALAAFAGSYAIIVALSASNLCSRIDEGQILCETPAATHIAEIATAIILLGVFTFAPLVLAFCGLIFLLRAAVRRWSLHRSGLTARG